MIVTFLTDFGVADAYVGVMKGVVLGIAPEATPVDITNAVPAGGIATGAYHLLTAYPHFPPGTVHVAVVDPGVGTARRPIAIQAAGQYFVGPDNGLLGYLLDAEPDARVVRISNTSILRQPVSDTFHGRDIFAPAGAALAAGVPFATLGPGIADPVRLPGIAPVADGPGRWLGRILHVDHFGNVVTSFSGADVADDPGVEIDWRLVIGDAEVLQLRRDYAGGDSGVLFAVRGSAGFLEVSCNGASAAALLGVRIGDPVTLRRDRSDRGG